MRVTKTATGHISQEISEATEIKIQTNIRLGPASLAQKADWLRFWKRLIDEVDASERQ
jgi:hypothetical protein